LPRASNNGDDRVANKDGVSLTVVERDESSFVVSLVAYTQANTNLTRRKAGDAVNLETDIIARYVEQLLAARQQ